MAPAVKAWHFGRQAPRQAGADAGRDCQVVETAEHSRQALLAALGKPVAGEAGHDAPADQCDQNRHGGDAEPQAQTARRGQTDGFQMGEQIARREDSQDAHDRQVAPIAARQNLAQHRCEKHDREREIYQRGRQWPDKLRSADRDPAQDPYRGQQRQTAAAQRQPAGPIGDRGQQETGDDRGDEAEQHFVRVPGGWIEGRGQDRKPGQFAEPDRDRQRRPGPGTEEKRPEPGTQDRRTIIGAARGRRRGRIPEWPMPGAITLAFCQKNRDNSAKARNGTIGRALRRWRAGPQPNPPVPARATSIPGRRIQAAGATKAARLRPA